MTSAGNESELPEIKRLQTCALDRTVARIGSAQLTTCFDSPVSLPSQQKRIRRGSLCNHTLPFPGEKSHP